MYNLLQSIYDLFTPDSYHDLTLSTNYRNYIHIHNAKIDLDGLLQLSNNIYQLFVKYDTCNDITINLKDKVVCIEYNTNQEEYPFDPTYFYEEFILEYEPKMIKERNTNYILNEYVTDLIIDNINLEKHLNQFNKENINYIVRDIEMTLFHENNKIYKILKCDNLIHEAFICKQLNLLGLPNFPKFLAIGYVNKRLHIAKKGYTCLITEYYQSVTFEYYIKYSEFNNFKNLLKQIIYVIAHTNTLIEFTHYDLHTKNILIKTLDEEIEIEYQISPSEKRKIKTKELVILIDFEYSHIKYEGMDIGISARNINIYNVNFWLHDILKLLFLTYKKAMDDPKKRELIINLLYHFLNRRISKSEYKKYSSVNRFFNLRYFKSTMKLIDFIHYMEKLI